MGALEKRAVEASNDFNSQAVANVMWSCIVFKILCSDFTSKIVCTLVNRLMEQWRDDLCVEELSQVHQFLLTCELDHAFGSDLSERVLQQLKSKARMCKRAFQEARVSPSQTQLSVSSTLRDMDWVVEDETHCVRSGYSIDMLVRAGLEDPNTTCWAVEFDGPDHFLTGTDGAPTGSTLIKRRHLELMGYRLVSIPYWEWDGLSDKGRHEYLARRLKESQQTQTSQSSPLTPALVKMGHGVDVVTPFAPQHPADHMVHEGDYGSEYRPSDQNKADHVSRIKDIQKQLKAARQLRVEVEAGGKKKKKKMTVEQKSTIDAIPALEQELRDLQSAVCERKTPSNPGKNSTVHVTHIQHKLFSDQVT